MRHTFSDQITKVAINFYLESIANGAYEHSGNGMYVNYQIVDVPSQYTNVFVRKSLSLLIQYLSNETYISSKLNGCQSYSFELKSDLEKSTQKCAMAK